MSMYTLSTLVSRDHDQNNIGTLRFLGAFMVLFGHSYVLLLGAEQYDPISLWMLEMKISPVPIHSLGVRLFFVLSGLLVAQSWMNQSNIWRYISARALRIYPGLIATVFITIFIIGPIVTTLHLTEYFNSIETWHYLVNNSTLNHIEFDLPGMFGKNLMSAVNGSLWSLKVELRMYILVAIVGSFGILRRPSLLVLISVVIMVLYFISPDSIFYWLGKHEKTNVAGYFLLGTLAYTLREKIFISPLVLLFLVVVAGVSLHSPLFEVAFAIAFTYFILILAYYPAIRLPHIEKFGDLSYGLYLYAFPLQQCVILYLKPDNMLAMLGYSSAFTLVAAIISWYCFEKPALDYRPNLANWLSNIAHKGKVRAKYITAYYFSNS